LGIDEAGVNQGRWIIKFNLPRVCLPTVLGQLLLGSVYAQDTFRNLDFELANLPDLPLGQYGSLNGVLASDTIPFWSAYYGLDQQSMITHNNYTLDSANISLLGPNWLDPGFGASIIDGKYSAVLQAGNVGNAQHVSVSIAQTGMIPPDTKSIRVSMNPFGGSSLGISLGGQNVPTLALGEDKGYWEFGADIAKFAGQTIELRLTAETSPENIFHSFGLDDIVFSNQPIPEPATTAILLSGLALWHFGYRRNRG
jgi:hypothetical protein